MAACILRRLALGLVTIGLVSALIFLGVEALPGDACTAILGRDAFGEALMRCREVMGLNTPALTRYADGAGGILRGDLGLSAGRQVPISESGGRPHAQLGDAGGRRAGLWVPLSILAGVIAGLTRDRWPDLVLSVGAICVMTIPEFVAATILILVFAIWLGWGPAIVLTPADAAPLEFFPEFILAATVLTMLMIAHIMRMVRAAVWPAITCRWRRSRGCPIGGWCCATPCPMRCCRRST